MNGVGNNVLYLDVEVRRIRKMLEESWPQKVAEQAEHSARAQRETELREAYNARHSAEGPKRA
jgi:hypothetical protein